MIKTTFVFFLISLFSVGAYGQNDDDRLVTIPVIFHVIYCDSLPENGMGPEVRNSNTGNSTSRLPREKIMAELQDLDEDFQNLNQSISNVGNDFKSVIGNPRIHFVLSDIVYHFTNYSYIKVRNNAPLLHKLSTMRDEDRSLNVYISALRVKGGGSEGLTNVPSEELPNEDAVNLNYSWVGLHYHLLSHEVGHWLGLWHVDDESQINITHVTDIPVQTELTDIFCVICKSDKVKVIKRQRETFKEPNPNNFMDYSGCRSMFSIQQCKYMRNLIIRLRPETLERHLGF